MVWYFRAWEVWIFDMAKQSRETRRGRRRRAVMRLTFSMAAMKTLER